MQIAIVHYHLNRGGVTQVIANHLRALDASLAGESRGRVLLLYDGRREGWPEDVPAACANLDITLAAVPELEYDDRGGSSMDAEALAAALHRALVSHGFAPDETLLHVHNHALGKNAALPGAATQLAEQGTRLLLQVHDFAEDFRPDLYHHLASTLAADDPAQLPKRLYPQGSQVHYAVLNGRDRELLAGAGIESSHLHWLPNPVAPFGELPSHDEARAQLAEKFGIDAERPLFLYPVRGIRRKNLGEMLLLAAAAGDDATFATTLTPLNPTERASCDMWRLFAAELELACHFGIGDEGGLGFVENISAADAIVTTSVAEGFGMVYLEAWLAGRPLIGRNLPDITADFVEHGLQLDDLYSRLTVPLDWVDEEAFRHSLVQTFHAALEQYGREDELADRFDPYFDEVTDGGTVDFGSLDVDLQQQVIVLVKESAERRDELLQLNRMLWRSFLANADGCREAIDHNAQVIAKNYSLEVFGDRLRDLYRIILAGPATGTLSGPPQGEAILDAFLDIRHFRPLRTFNAAHERDPSA